MATFVGTGSNMDHATTIVAVSAVSSPWWLQALHAVSDGAALVLPILGVIWLVIQMTAWFLKKKKG